MLRTINFMGVRNVAFGVTLLLTVLALFRDRKSVV